MNLRSLRPIATPFLAIDVVKTKAVAFGRLPPWFRWAALNSFVPQIDSFNDVVGTFCSSLILVDTHWVGILFKNNMFFVTSLCFLTSRVYKLTPALLPFFTGPWSFS